MNEESPMAFTFNLDRSEFATKDDVRREAARRFPLFRVAAILTEGATYKVSVDDIIKKNAEKPFPLKELGDDEDKLDNKEEPDSHPKKKDDHEGNKNEEDESDSDNLPKLIKQLKGLLEDIAKAVGVTDEPKLDEESDLPKPKLPSPDPGPSALPPGPPGGVAGPGPMPGGPKKRPMPGGGALPVFTNVRNTIIKECSATVKQEEAVQAFESEFPDYDPVEMRMVGNRWVIKAQLRAKPRG